MKWEGIDFTPATNYNLIWTLKADPITEADCLAQIQKVLASGITVTDTYATLTILPPDTAGDGSSIAPVDPGKYYWDLQYQDTDIPDDVRTVRYGTLDLYRDVTRDTTAAITIYSDTPISLTSFVSHESTQALTSAQKEQFWTNAGLTAYADITAANASALPVGAHYYDIALVRPNSVTA